MNDYHGEDPRSYGERMNAHFDRHRDEREKHWQLMSLAELAQAIEGDADWPDGQDGDGRAMVDADMLRELCRLSGLSYAANRDGRAQLDAALAACDDLRARVEALEDALAKAQDSVAFFRGRVFYG